jgi:hypothetical protein
MELADHRESFASKLNLATDQICVRPEAFVRPHGTLDESGIRSTQHLTRRWLRPDMNTFRLCPSDQFIQQSPSNPSPPTLLGNVDGVFNR